MNPTQIAIEQLHVAYIQAWITGLAILIGPWIGVYFTFRYQDRKDRRSKQRELFLLLLTERKLAYSEAAVKGMNTIAVVFDDSQEVVQLWHKYYALLSGPVSQERDHTWLELLTAMAVHLGHRKLRQVDLDKFYFPQGHADRQAQQTEATTELLRILKSTKSLKIEEEEPSK